MRKERVEFELPPVTAPSDLTQLPLPAAGLALVLAPHPDDFDAIAVTLKHFQSAGWTLRLCVLTAGVSGVSDDFPAADSREAKTAIRQQEQLASCKLFGLESASVSFLKLAADSNGTLGVDTDNIEHIQSTLQKHVPHLVFMPHGHDSNTTHQRCAELLKAAATGTAHRFDVLYNRDAKTIAMRDDYYVPFNDVQAQWKSRLLTEHHSQQHRNMILRGTGFDQRVLEVNRDIARRVAIPARYAESFELGRF